MMHGAPSGRFVTTSPVHTGEENAPRPLIFPPPFTGEVPPRAAVGGP
jgi:hypothetical protein